MYRILSLSLLALLAAQTTALGQSGESNAEIQRFQGSWRVTELIEDGKVIPQEQIKTTLPSGGQAEIISNTIQFNSPTSGRTAKVFSVDPTIYPKAIVVSTLERPEGFGIYKFEGERLILCMSDPVSGQRPTDFSSRPGSKHMLMVLERAESVQNAGPPTATSPPTQTNTTPTPEQVSAPQATNTAPPAASTPPPVNAAPATTTQPPQLVALPAPPVAAPEPTAATARVLTDAEVTTMLRGAWRLNDGAGVLQVSFDPNGSYRSYREVQDPSSFNRMFVQTPVAAGTWTVQNGNLVFHITSSTDLNRVNHTFYIAIRSISQTDFIFVDSLGRVVKAVKLR